MMTRGQFYLLITLLIKGLYIFPQEPEVNCYIRFFSTVTGALRVSLLTAGSSCCLPLLLGSAISVESVIQY